jgi:hypothetical protein
MEARSALFRAAAVFSADERIAPRLAGAISGVLMLALALASLALIVRRGAGGLSSPLSVAALAATGAIAAIIAASIRWLVDDISSSGGFSPRGQLVLWLPSVALIAMAAAVSLPGSSPIGLAFLWLVTTAEEVWSWRHWRRIRGTNTAERVGTPRRRSAHVKRGVGESQTSMRAAAGAPPSPSGDVIQRLTRTCSAAGIERIEGWLKAVAAPGERTLNLHAAFCPPFERIPQFTVIQSSGPTGRVRAVQLLPYGVRLELKLNEPSGDKAAIVIEFAAECQQETTQAKS